MAHFDADSLLYGVVRRLGAPFRYRVVGLDNIRDSGPAIFIANHLGSTGPVAAILSLPVRFYPWVRAEMADFRRAAAYLYDDFVSAELRLTGRAGRTLSWLISRISVCLINGIGCVAVEGPQHVVVSTYRRSLDLLIAGKNLLIFPEDNIQPADPETGLRPFKCGFIGLCRIYERASGSRLPVYPMALHPGRRTIAVGDAAYLDDNGDPRCDVRTTCQRLRSDMGNLMLALEAGG